MAIQGINPVSAPRESVKVTPSKTAKGLGNVLGAIGGIAGGIAGFAGGGAPGAVAGATGGASTGLGLGRNIGESISPSTQERISQPTPSGGGGGTLKLSRQGEIFAESLRILQEMPPELAAPHSKSLTAALMSEIAKTNTGGQA